MQIVAPAKINLYLHVLGRRDDGYHLLDSLIAFAAARDTLTVRTADALSLTIEGRFAGALPDSGDGNLVLRAAAALIEGAGRARGAHITLTKDLPVASGIGGGSSDAAAALKLLNEFWRLGRSPAELARLGAALGADVPVCLHGATAYIGGIGEAVDAVPALPAVGVVLVNPAIAVSTSSVFAALAGSFSEPARVEYTPYDAASLAVALAARRNDLTAPAADLAPVINDVLSALGAQPGCLLSRLSGSGATCFGLFSDSVAARHAADGISAAHDDWWVVETRFLDHAPLPVAVA